MRVRMRRAREAASCPYLSACRCWLVDDRTAPVEGLHFHYPATAPKCRVEQRLLAESCRPVHLRARIRQMYGVWLIGAHLSNPTLWSQVAFDPASGCPHARCS
ncbi:MAG: hypothetical protein EOP26_10675 [Rhodococcus sp. (in: high G+C Gram-positive bacteria)]|nr:MAG: hypothetical protein EOP26_10675 [Rhodococcus sp. (in: high G+C Gram-positive bacteria)]